MKSFYLFVVFLVSLVLSFFLMSCIGLFWSDLRSIINCGPWMLFGGMASLMVACMATEEEYKRIN